MLEAPSPKIAIGRVVGPPHLGREGGAGRHRDSGADYRERRKQAYGGVAQVHGSAHAAYRTDPPSHDLAHDRHGRHAQRQGMAVAPVGAGHRVGGPGGRRDPDRDPLLALACVGGAVHQTLEEHGLHPGLEGADPAHGFEAGPPA